MDLVPCFLNTPDIPKKAREQQLQESSSMSLGCVHSSCLALSYFLFPYFISALTWVPRISISYVVLKCFLQPQACIPVYASFCFNAIVWLILYPVPRTSGLRKLSWPGFYQEGLGVNHIDFILTPHLEIWEMFCGGSSSS